MKHLGLKYDAIKDKRKDKTKRIPENEPVFLLRGKDSLAPMVISFWANLLRAQGGQEHLAHAAQTFAKAMEAYQEQNGNQLPDCEINDLHLRFVHDQFLNDEQKTTKNLLNSLEKHNYIMNETAALFIDHGLDSLRYAEAYIKQDEPINEEPIPRYEAKVNSLVPDDQGDMMVTMTIMIPSKKVNAIIGSGKEIKITL